MIAAVTQFRSEITDTDSAENQKAHQKAGTPQSRQPVRVQKDYNRWISYSEGDINAIFLARMLSSFREGHSALNETLGLKHEKFKAMMAQYFPYMPDLLSFSDRLLKPIPEKDQLKEMLLHYRAGRCASESWLAEIIIAGCQGQEHLWYDLGLWSRDDLQALLKHNFPGLVSKNRFDMKWKKFLYRQLCLDSGITMCRSPSCGECSDYEECFSPED